MVIDDLLAAVEHDERLDPFAAALGRSAVALAGSPVGPVLQGRWLGHSLHPLMTDIPIGCWTCAAMLDVVGGRGARAASTRLVGLGTLSALPTAVTGLASFATVDEADDASRRVAALHVACNLAAIGTYSISWHDRRRGRRVRGLGWSVVGAVVATVAGHLGGHLAFVRGVGHGSATGGRR